MTYRELIEYCHKTPVSKCPLCKYSHECTEFTKQTGFMFPSTLYRALHFELGYDKEIEVEE